MTTQKEQGSAQPLTLFDFYEPPIDFEAGADLDAFMDGWDALESRIRLETFSRKDGNWIQTFSGGRFYPANPDPAEIHLVDIAHALSNMCRYTGHVKAFYSVAEHCVRVAKAGLAEAVAEGMAKGSPEYQRLGRSLLLHDASEAYLVDIARPVKRLPIMAGYFVLEGNLMRAIARKYNFDWPMTFPVQRWDNILLLAEKRDLMPPCVWPSTFGITDDIDALYPQRIAPWPPLRAKANFLKMAESLGLHD